MKLEQKIIYVSGKEMEAVKKEFDETIYWREISGENITNFQEYLEETSRSFNFPIPAKGWSGYEDWMRDFSWVDQKKIVFIINQYSRFLRAEPEMKEELIEDFEELIFPWWNEEVVDCVVGGERKSFIVYLVD